MNIIQQNFKTSSILLSGILFIPTIFSLYIYNMEYESLNEYYFNIFSSFFIGGLSCLSSYYLSYVFSFEKEGIIVSSFWGLIGKKRYYFKNVKKVEYSINPNGTLDCINLYFKEQKNIN